MYVLYIYLSALFLMASGGTEFTSLFNTLFIVSDLNLPLTLGIGSSDACTLPPHPDISVLGHTVHTHHSVDLVNLGVCAFLK